MTCTRCTAPTATGIYLCHACTTRLEDVLDRVPEALTNVQTTVARMDRVGHGTTTSGNRPEAVNVSALDEKIDLTEKIHSWARTVLECESRDDLRSVEPLAYLRMSMHLIRGQDFAGDLLDELEDAVRSVERVIDRPVEKIAYGSCGALHEDGSACMATLTAEEGSEWATCRDCGARWDVEVRESMVRDRVRGEPMRAAECRRWLSKNAGTVISPKDFENWVYIGALGYVLDRVTTNGRPPRIYFPGDVLRVHFEMRDRKCVAA